MGLMIALVRSAGRARRISPAAEPEPRKQLARFDYFLRRLYLAHSHNVH